MSKKKPDAPERAVREREVVLQSRFLEDLSFWISTNARTAARLVKMMKEIQRTPFEGTGKPEPLRYLGPDTWSRRLTEADRIVYLVRDDAIHFLQARYHY